MSSSHSSALHLNLEIINDDHVTLSSSVHIVIPHIDDDDIEDGKFESMPIPRDTTPFFFPLMKINNSNSKIFKPCSGDSSNKAQVILGETILIS